MGDTKILSPREKAEQAIAAIMKKQKEEEAKLGEKYEKALEKVRAKERKIEEIKERIVKETERLNELIQVADKLKQALDELGVPLNPVANENQFAEPEDDQPETVQPTEDFTQNQETTSDQPLFTMA